MVLWALGHQQALFLAFWAICAPHCAFAAPSPLRPSFDNPSRMLAQPHSTVASDDPRILPSAISVGMTATTSLVPADLPSGTPAHFVTESWTANDTPESPRGIAQGPVVSSPEEQAVAAWAPALKEGSTQKSFVSPLTDAPFIVVAAVSDAECFLHLRITPTLNVSLFGSFDIHHTASPYSHFGHPSSP